MRRGHSAVLPFAVASLVLAGWLISAPLLGQSKGNPRTANPRADADETSASNGETERDDIRAREEWFYRQRRYPLAAIPGGARLIALERKEEMRRAQREQANAAARGNTRAFTALPLLAAAAAWTSIGPTPTISSDNAIGVVSGRVTALAVDPTNSNIVFAGGAQGGVWKSTDAGVNWTTTFDAEKTLAIGAIAIDTSATSCGMSGPCQIIYVGTGEQNFSGDSYYGAGVYKSTDGGMTWTQIPNETITNPQAGAPNSFLPPAAPFNQAVGGVHIGAIAVHPTTPARIFAAVQIFENVGGGASSGLYCSDDSGGTWTQVISGAIGTDVAIHPAGMIGYAALGSNNGDTAPAGGHAGDNGIYKSTNANAACASQVWTLISAAPVPTGTNAGVIRLGLAPSDANAKTVYAAVANPISSKPPFNTTLAGVFKTLDGGATWSNVTPSPDFCTPQCDYDLVVKVHPNDLNTVFVGGSRTLTNSNLPFYLLRTTDGGTSWTPIAQDSNGTLLHVDQHAIAFGFNGANVNSIYVGNDGGVWSSPLLAPGNSVIWTDLNQTLSLSQFYPGMSIDPSNANLGFGGTQDNGSQKFSSAQQWSEQPPCGDGGYTAIDPATPATVYVSCQMIDIHKSTDDGLDGFPISADSGINQSDRSEFIPPLVIDPNPNTSTGLYFGTFRVWQTMNGGGSWSAISPDLTAGPANSPDITSLAVSPLNSDVVYAGTFDSRLWRTTNASSGTNASWTELDGGTVPPRTITYVAADPNNQDVVFVTFSGFSGFQINPGTTDTQGHVFRCSATQSSCTDISGSGAGALPNVPVNAIVVDPIDALSETLYIGTDVGMFATMDGGMTWEPDFPGAPNGLPNVAVLSLTLQPSARILRAGTHGRGAWDLQLSSTAPLRLASLAPNSAAVNTANLVLTLNGSGFTANSKVLINNAARTTTFQSTTQLTVNLTANDLASVGTLNVQVSDSTTTPTSSGVLTFTVTNDFSFCVGSPGMACSATGSGSTPRGVTLPTALTVAPAQNAAFPANVVISCSGLPNESSCNFSSTAAGFVGGATGNLPAADGTMGTTQVNVSFLTTAPSLVTPRFQRGLKPPMAAPPLVVFAWRALLLALIGALIAAARYKTLGRAPVRWALAALLILAFAGLTGACGGSSGNGGGGGGGGGNAGTTPGMYPITITATSGNDSHSVTFTLTVTQ